MIEQVLTARREASPSLTLQALAAKVGDRNLLMQV